MRFFRKSSSQRMVLMSRWLVGSSSRRSLEVSRALARATRRRDPPERDLKSQAGSIPVGPGPGCVLLRQIVLPSLAHGVGQREHPAFLAHAGGRHAEDGARPVERHVLGHEAEAAAPLVDETSPVRLYPACQHPEQGGLADAVAADEADAVADIDAEAGVFEQRLAAEAEADVLEGEQRHGGSFVRAWPDTALALL